jgi:thiosulfate/3-mercaptopyruvate sulfurtransferase
MRTFVNMVVVLAAVITLTISSVLPTAAVPSAVRPGSAAGPLVSASWLAQLGADPSVVVVDMRPADAYAQGHIPGAVNLPVQTLAQPNTDEPEVGPWQARTMELLGSLGISPASVVVAYDENGSLFAARMRWVLTHLGHESALVLDGGLTAWTALGQPLTTTPTVRPPTAYVGTPDARRLAGWKDVLERLGNPNVQLIDVRPVPGYTGENPGTARRGGHIPTALNLDWSNNVQAQAPRSFKSLAELQTLYDGLGLDRNKEIIVYCTTGIQASNTLLVLEMLGYPNVRLYSGSWSEWSNRDDLPIAVGPDPGTAPN